jgi:hypothetical protein
MSHNEMTSRERFCMTMAFETPDRVPYFEEGIRDEVLEAWRGQGLAKGADLGSLFTSDIRREIILDLDPKPEMEILPKNAAGLADLETRLNPEDPRRLPQDWSELMSSTTDDGAVRMLRIHRGLFLTMGVRSWDRFKDVMELIVDHPDIVRQIMLIQGRFCAGMADRVLKKIKVDAAIFSEPIGGNDRPLISPKMYEDLVLESYTPVLDVLRQNNVKTFIFRTFANSRILIPSIIKWGFNCLWACEVNCEAMDYRAIRKTFGKDLRLIGGIDLDALRHGREAVYREVMEKVPPLLEQGGYIPLADGRVREDVWFETYAYYRTLLQKIIKME